MPIDPLNRPLAVAATPWQRFKSDYRPTVFSCRCGRSFLAIPALNPLYGADELHPPSFFDGDRVVDHCPDCRADLFFVFRFGGRLPPAPALSSPNQVVEARESWAPEPGDLAGAPACSSSGVPPAAGAMLPANPACAGGPGPVEDLLWEFNK